MLTFFTEGHNNANVCEARRQEREEAEFATYLAEWTIVSCFRYARRFVSSWCDVSPWLAYNDLAWTEAWLTDPTGTEQEACHYVALLRRHVTVPSPTLLHLGSGAGGMDGVFKQHFTVTGVDLSPGMLARARSQHPDIEYLEGDMRTIQLGRQFDAVAIPDSIDYMATREELAQALATAVAHLRPGGTLLVVAKTLETFRNNNFAYSGEREGIHVTLLENNHVYPERPEAYEAVLHYLVRKDGELVMHTDRHMLGLFPQAAWEAAFRDLKLRFEQSILDGVYDDYLLGEGAYPMQVFIGVKPPERA